MSSPRLWIVLLLGGLGVACRDTLVIFPQPDSSDVVRLTVGESRFLQHGDVEIGFRSTLEDSRCPAGTMCLWEGRAAIRLWLLQASSDSIFITSGIHGHVERGDTCCHQSVDTLGYQLTLLQLDPYPSGDSVIRFDAYKALLRIAKL